MATRKFTKIPSDTFESLQLDAGVILKNFDPDNVVEPQDADMVCATTGGITINCQAQYSDLGEDVDNCPGDLMELKHLDKWSCTMQFTALSTSEEGFILALGAADVDPTTGAVKPRKDLMLTDFVNRWWVGDRADGGAVAVKIKNALSDSGFSLKTTKDGKGNLTVTLKGHVSINHQDDIPMEFYSLDPETPATYTYTAVTPVGTENPVQKGWYVLVGDSYRLTSDTEVDSNVTYYKRTTT